MHRQTEEFVVAPLPLSARAVARAERYKEGKSFMVEVVYPPASTTGCVPEQSYRLRASHTVDRLLTKSCERFGLAKER